MHRKYQLMTNTFLLATSSFILRATGVFFHAYLAGRIGATGIGLFSLVMSVYQFGVTFACSGIGLASTRVVAEELAEGRVWGMRQSVNCSLVHAFLFGGMALIGIGVGAPFLGKELLGDERTVLPLRILAISLPCVAMSSALNGYFSAVGRVGKSALVQIVEQGIRMGGCMLLLSSGKNFGVEQACVSIVACGSVAEICSFFLLFICYRRDTARYGKQRKGMSIFRRLLQISMPVAVSSYMRSGLSTAEHAFIPKGLKKHSGNPETALASYGAVHGMALPLILFPSAVLQAFSSVLIPEVTKHRQMGETGKIDQLIEKTLEITMIFSVGCSGILFFFSEEIGTAVYRSREVAYYIRLIAPLAIVMYADGVVDAVLKGLNQQVYSMGYNIADSALAVLLMFFLLPAYGITGYVMIIYITEMVNAFLSITRLLYVSEFKLHPVKNAAVPVLGIASCSLFSKAVLNGATAPVLTALLYILFMCLYSGKTTLAKKVELC
ncbi:MAG: polysaccharide biosynthesis protein [Clostridia bacterium]|nr:polysaccharide biosynthesis protein [Clostridia bacterium]